MSSIFSVISGQFSKSILLSAFFPATVFVLFAIFGFQPFVPSAFGSDALAALDPQWKVAGTTLVIMIVSGLLFNLNTSILRLFEGYPWQQSFIGSWLVRKHCKEYDTAKLRYDCLYALLINISDGDPRRDTLVAERSDLGLLLNENYPARELILPTQLGNIIRSFEYYPVKQYGIDTITAWPRLLSVIDKDYSAAIDDSKIPVDFMVNGLTLSCLLSASLLITGFAHPNPLFDPTNLTIWLSGLVGSVLLAWGCYLGCIASAHSWGAMVKSAFDLYHEPLLSKLGHVRVTPMIADERDLWTYISNQMRFGDDVKIGPRIQYSTPESPFARDFASDALLEVTKGISQVDSNGSITVRVLIRNSDSKVATDVVLTDRLPTTFIYRWDSAEVDIGDVIVTGTNPYYFTLVGDIGPNVGRSLTYQAVPFGK